MSSFARSVDVAIDRLFQKLDRQATAAPPLRSRRVKAPSAKPVTVSRRCTACGADMTGKRPQATTCSPRCRQRLSRDRRGLHPKPIGVVVYRPRARRKA